MIKKEITSETLSLIYDIIKLNEEQFENLLSEYNGNEIAVYKRMNPQKKFKEFNNVSFLGIGRFYHVFKISNFVLKIERKDSPIKYPALNLYKDSSALISSSEKQKSLGKKLKGLESSKDVLFKSAINQHFYYDKLPKLLNKESYPDTEFILFESNNMLYEGSIQPYYDYPNLMKSLRTSLWWTLLLSRWKLLPMYNHHKTWVVRDLNKFIKIGSIDHRPDNFILDTENHNLVLIDLKEMNEEAEKYNQMMLNNVKQSIEW